MCSPAWTWESPVKCAVRQSTVRGERAAATWASQPGLHGEAPVSNDSRNSGFPEPVCSVFTVPGKHTIEQVVYRSYSPFPMPPRVSAASVSRCHWDTDLMRKQTEAEQFPSVELVRRVPVLVTKTKETLPCLFVCFLLPQTHQYFSHFLALSLFFLAKIYRWLFGVRR